MTDVVPTEPGVQSIAPRSFTDALVKTNRPARAAIRLSWGKVRFKADAEITPLGLLAIGGMVGTILLAVVPIVRAAGASKRR